MSLEQNRQTIFFTHVAGVVSCACIFKHTETAPGMCFIACLWASQTIQSRLKQFGTMHTSYRGVGACNAWPCGPDPTCMRSTVGLRSIDHITC